MTGTRLWHPASDVQGRKRCSLRTIPRNPISCGLCLGFSGKYDNGSRVHARVARTVGQVIDFAVLIPVHRSIPADGHGGGNDRVSFSAFLVLPPLQIFIRNKGKENSTTTNITS